MSPLSPSEAREHALTRLNRSRARLRTVLVGPDEDAMPSDPADLSARSPSRTFKRLWRAWRRRWRQTPVVDLVMGGVQTWWSSQSWRPVVERAGDEVHAAVVPAVRRHPWAAVGLAAGLGAAVVVTRPWHWSSVRTSARALRRQLWSAGLVFAAQWPWQAVLASLSKAPAADGEAAAAGTSDGLAIAPLTTAVAPGTAA